MGEAKLSYHTIEEYLAQEELSEFKSEYTNGHIRAMSGGSFNHGFIGGNIYHAVKTHIERKQLNCTPINSDVRLFIDSANSFVYPDTAVVFGEIKESKPDKDSYVNPTIVVEVMSESTGGYDRGYKFHKYSSLPPFKKYVIIDQYKPVVDIFYREDNESWKMITTIRLDKSIYLHILDCHISMQDVYNNVRDLQETTF